MKLTKEYITIFAIQVTEVLGFSLVLPFLPFYAQKFNASPLQISFIFTAFSLFQFFSAPVMGRLSDHYGRKPLLIISQLSTLLSFIILGFANSYWMIMLSRIVDGLFGSNFVIAQAYLSDISSEKDRSKAFGISGAAFGFGFLIGPAIGGYLATNYGFSVPGFVAAGVAFVTVLTTALLLKETVKEKKSLTLNWKMLFHFRDVREFFSDDVVRPRLLEFFMFVLSHSVFVGTFALYAERQLGFNSQNVGFFLMYIGVISILIRSILLSKLIDLFGEKKLQYIGLYSVFVGMVLMIFVKTVPFFLVAATLFSFGGGVSRPVITGNISRLVSKKRQGAILGVTNSLASVSQIFGPLLGGFMLNYFFPGSMGIAGAAVILVGIIIMLKNQ